MNYEKLRLERLPEVLARTGLGRSRLYELQATGDFPASVPLGSKRSVAFVEREVDAWIQKQIDVRNSGSAPCGGGSKKSIGVH